MQPRATHARKEYEQAALDEADIIRDPIRQFAAWYDAAVAAGVPEPEAMTLSTATPDGHPSARVVLLRGFDERGFCFFTNYESGKGRQLPMPPSRSTGPISSGRCGSKAAWSRPRPPRATPTFRAGRARRGSVPGVRHRAK
jgi:hypothetical protein